MLLWLLRAWFLLGTLKATVFAYSLTHAWIFQDATMLAAYDAVLRQNFPFRGLSFDEMHATLRFLGLGSGLFLLCFYWLGIANSRAENIFCVSGSGAIVLTACQVLLQLQGWPGVINAWLFSGLGLTAFIAVCIARHEVPETEPQEDG